MVEVAQNFAKLYTLLIQNSNILILWLSLTTFTTSPPPPNVISQYGDYGYCRRYKLLYPTYVHFSNTHSFYTCLKHQFIHLTIVLLRSIYLGFIVVWSFIPRGTLYCRKIHDRPRCGAAQRGRLNYITNANAHVHILD